MDKRSLKFYSRISAIIIWLIFTGFSVHNLTYMISLPLILIPILFLFIANLIMYGDLNIFKSGIERTAIFLEKRLSEIKNIK